MKTVDRGAAIAALREIPPGPSRDDRIAALAAVVDEPETTIRAEVAGVSVPSPPLSWRSFPVDALPTPLAGYVTSVADAIGVDPSFVALPVLVTLAGTIGNRARVELKSSWSESAVLWGVIIGRSGLLKSPTLAEVTRPVRRREAKVIAVHQRHLEDHERAVEAWADRPKGERGAKPEPPEPPARSLVSDVTVEALAERLSESPAGVLLYRDELAGWIRGFDRYRSGRGGDAQAWLEMHRAGSILVDRKTAGALSVPRAAVSIVGSVQPEVLHDALSGEHLVDGLAARLLFVMPPERPKRWTNAEIPLDVREGWAQLLDQLRTPYDRESTPLDLPLTDEAREIFVDFYNRHAAREADASSGAVAAAYSKLEGAAARFALILQLARDPAARAVGLQAMRAGVTLAGWFAHEAERVYGRFHETPEDRERRELLEWIEGRGGTVTERDLARGPRRYREPGSATQALEDLVTAGVGRWEDQEPGPRGGRPGRVFVLGDTGDGDTTGSVATGDETPERRMRTGRRPATEPPAPEEVVSPSPPGDKPESAFERYIDNSTGSVEI